MEYANSCCIRFWIFIIAIATGLADPNADLSTLQLVHVIWRHGDRTPSKGTFPSDTKNGEKTWPQGWGELTKEGMKQHYALGQYFRHRYVDTGFLSNDYNVTEIYVGSTSYNRTIMSALANLAGMYPPPDGARWKTDLAWQPIPIHSRPKEEDPMLWMDLPCPTANKTLEEIMKSDAVRKIEKENADFLKFLENVTSWGRPLPLKDVWFIFDPLNCERFHNSTHEVPTWVTPDVFNKIQHLSDLSSTFEFHDFRIQRLRGGLLFGDIASRMQAKAKNSTTFPTGLKYYAYSAHDTTLVALLENLGVYNGRTPQYATAIILELHNISDSFIVKVFHINETGSINPVQLVTPDCGATVTTPYCQLEAFVSMAQRRTPSDWKVECGIVSADAKKINEMTIAAIILGLIAGALIIVVVVLIWLLKRNPGATRIS